MGKTRRFRVASLGTATASEVRALPEDEVRHAKVLRLGVGSKVELFDGEGRAWLGGIEDAEGAWVVRLEAPVHERAPADAVRPRLVLAVAWPKGKRAATLIEKCTELGVDEIIPMGCARSVVQKASDSQGFKRLERIASEAAKQCGRADVPVLSAPRPFHGVIEEARPEWRGVLLHREAERSLADLAAEWRKHRICEGGAIVLLIGPEGGFSREELQAAERAGMEIAHLTPHTLRIETAAMAGCAVMRAVLD